MYETSSESSDYQVGRMRMQVQSKCNGGHKWGIAAADYSLDDEPIQRKVCVRRNCEAQKKWTVSMEEKPTATAILPSREWRRLVEHDWGHARVDAFTVEMMSRAG